MTRFPAIQSVLTGWLVVLCSLVVSFALLDRPAFAVTVGISGDKVTLDGVPTKMLGLSYFDGKHWHAEDLDDFSAMGYNLIRVIADWGGTDGLLHDTNARRLLDLVRYSNSKHIVVDLTVLNFVTTRDPHLQLLGPTVGAVLPAPHAADALEQFVRRLTDEPNVIFDVRNECNLHMPPPPMWENLEDRHECAYVFGLISRVKRIKPGAIAFASVTEGVWADTFPYTNYRASTVQPYIRGGFSLLAPHTDRGQDWQDWVGPRVAAIKRATNNTIPIYMQEENRQGYNDQVYPKEHFFTAIKAAFDNGAALVNFHTFAGFDLRQRRFMDNLRVDWEEDQIVRQLPGMIFGAGRANGPPIDPEQSVRPDEM